jgi:hypothetical protein
MALYKYLHPDRTDVLRNQFIRFSSPAVLNDPFELKPHVAALATPEYAAAELRRALPRVLAEELAQVPAELRALLPEEALHAFLQAQLPSIQKRLDGVSTQMMPLLQETMARKLEELLGVLCLSESPKSLLMWAHYADSHRGFVVQFDDTSPFFDTRVTENDELRHLRQVTYSSKRPSLTLSEVEDGSAFLTKGVEWEYEAEWRMIVPLADASQVIGTGPEAVHLFGFPAEAVTSVIFGCRMLEAKRAEIHALLASLPRYAHVRCIQASIDTENYILHVGPH